MAVEREPPPGQRCFPFLTCSETGIVRPHIHELEVTQVRHLEFEHVTLSLLKEVPWPCELPGTALPHGAQLIERGEERGSVTVRRQGVTTRLRNTR